MYRQILTAVLVVAALPACDGKSSKSETRDARYVLGSVVIDTDGNRTTYVQTVHALDEGPFTNANAIELAGNGVVMGGAKSFYVGLTEEPTWVRYSIDDAGHIVESGRMSLLSTGAGSIDYGNAIVDDETAVSVFSNPPLAVVWNPKTMTIRGEIPLAQLSREGYELEVWTTIAHNGLVYVPGRWSDWEGSRIFPRVSMTILDPKTMSIVGTAQDDRCASGGRVVFDAAGYAYVMGDGRNYSIQMFANASGGTAPDNCLLRIAPGQTTFEAGYFYKISSLTGGLQSIGELQDAGLGNGIGFSTMFYPDQLPADVKPVDFAFWDQPAHKMWRLNLTDPPRAEEVQGLAFSAIGFGGSALEGHLYSGQGADGGKTTVYEIDPDTNTAKRRFTMDGYFYGLYAL
jgi:hypothetical protein